jgi:regulator of protease activity HflC (stomatin/prohibitin superfamily)
MDMFQIFNFVVWGTLLLIVVSKFIQSVRIVSTRTALIVERLGKYHATLGPGFHLLLPFIDKVTEMQDLREETIDVPPQECFSKDEVKVEVDGVIYISVVDPVKATYGVTDYRFAATQLAQTTTRSVIGTLELDRTFEERDTISAKVVSTLSRAGETWGIMVHRYEIKNIRPPMTVQEAMEKQVNAERERRAIFAKSEGDKQSRINTSEGRKLEMINLSEGEMQKTINEAEGKASEILAVAAVTAESIEKIGAAVIEDGGAQAIRLDMAGKYITNLGYLASPETDVMLPADLTHFEKLLAGLELSVHTDAEF